MSYPSISLCRANTELFLNVTPHTYCLRSPTRSGRYLDPTYPDNPVASCYVCSLQQLTLQVRMQLNWNEIQLNWSELAWREEIYSDSVIARLDLSGYETGFLSSPYNLNCLFILPSVSVFILFTVWLESPYNANRFISDCHPRNANRYYALIRDTSYSIWVLQATHQCSLLLFSYLLSLLLFSYLLSLLLFSYSLSCLRLTRQCPPSKTCCD